MSQRQSMDKRENFIKYLKRKKMKFNKIISTVAIASMLTSGALAEGNQTENTAVPTPIVGGTIVNVAVTEISARGYRASKLLQSDIYNKDGDKIGTIDDFILGGNNTVSFAVLSVGGFLGLGTRNVAVPAILFESNEKGQIVLPNAKKDDLLALPEFRYAK